jgi:hypothetical protein
MMPILLLRSTEGGVISADGISPRPATKFVRRLERAATDQEIEVF